MNIVEYDSLIQCEKEIVKFQFQHNTNVFFDYDWMLLWKTYFGEKYKEKIILFYENGELKGFAPLVYYETRGFSTRIFRFYGGNMNGYNNIPAKKGYEQLVYRYLIDHLRKDKKAISIQIEDINDQTIDYEILHNLASKEKGIERYQYSCPYNYLDSNWDEFLKRQIPKKKKRNELKAFSKKLYNLGEVYLIRINDSESWENYKHLIDQTFYIHSLRFKEVLNTSRYSEANYKEFYSNVIERLAKKSKIDLSFLCLDNKVISFLFAFKDVNRLIDYIPGFHPSFSKISLGHVHLMELFQNLIEEQEIKIFDFSKGMGIYKQKWTDSIYNNFLFNFKLNNSFTSNINWFVNNQIINLKLFGRKKGWNNHIKHILGRVKNKIQNESDIEDIQIVEVIEDLKLDKNSFTISKFRYEDIANLNMNAQKFIIEEVLMKKEVLLWNNKNNLEFIEIVDDINRKLYQCKDGDI